MTTEERQSVVAQEQPPSPPIEETPAAQTSANAPGPDATPVSVPSQAPPAPPGRPFAERLRHMPSGGRWAWGVALTILGGFSWWIYGFIVASVGFGVGPGRDVFAILVSMLVAAVPALTCLIAGWLLRSWWGLIAAPLVYVAVSALLWVLAAVGDFWTAEFALYVLLPAVVMSAIGAAIGAARAR